MCGDRFRKKLAQRRATDHERHLARVAEKAEARNVGDSVDRFRAAGFFVNLLQREAGSRFRVVIAATAAASDSGVARSFFNAVVITQCPAVW